MRLQATAVASITGTSLASGRAEPPRDVWSPPELRGGSVRRAHAIGGRSGRAAAHAVCGRVAHSYRAGSASGVMSTYASKRVGNSRRSQVARMTPPCRESGRRLTYHSAKPRVQPRLVSGSALESNHSCGASRRRSRSHSTNVVTCLGRRGPPRLRGAPRDQGHRRRPPYGRRASPCGHRTWRGPCSRTGDRFCAGRRRIRWCTASVRRSLWAHRVRGDRGIDPRAGPRESEHDCAPCGGGP
jgi:hypothetical protein